MRRFAPLLLALLGAAVAVAAYMQAFDYPFVSDDVRYLAGNNKLAGLHLAELWRLFTEPYNDFSEFLPLRDFSFWLDIKLFGLNPSASRMHNILLYLLCMPLVYAVTLELWRYFRPADASAPWAAAAVTALFALHPALVESVVWVSGRKYVLPNLFSLLALWLAVYTRRERGLSAPHAAATLIAFVAVMLSKASYVAVAPVIAMLWMLFWLDIPKPERRRSHLLWPLAILFLAAILIRIFIASSKDNTPAYFGMETASRTLAVLGWLTRLAVSPESRHFFYPVFEDPYLPVMVALGVAVLAITATSAMMILRKRSLEGFAVIAFLLLCVPYLQLIPYGPPPSLVQDRFLALAMWPVILLIVALCWRLKPVPCTVLLLAIALPWVYQTIERPKDWRSFEAIINTDLRAYPGHYLPAAYKATSIQIRNGMFRDAAETAGNVKIPEARNMLLGEVDASYAVYVDAASTGKPDRAIGRLLNFGHMLKEPPAQARWNAPVKYIWNDGNNTLTNLWWLMASMFPDDAMVNYHGGLWLLDSHKYKNAVSYFRVAVGSPQLPEHLRGTAFSSLGNALLNSGNAVEAEAPLRAALEQPQPDLRTYCLLAEVYKQTGRAGEAARAKADCPGDTSDQETAQ